VRVVIEAVGRRKTLLEEIVVGPDRELVYGPLLPAILGPDVTASERGRRVALLAYEGHG
jgi:hypothetical protein